MDFNKILSNYNWDTIYHRIHNATPHEVESVLKKSGNLTTEDFAKLISPAAQGYLEEMASRSQQLTRQRFGHNISLFAPLYLSNECQNICTYCGFSMHNKIPRRTLTIPEIRKEIDILKNRGLETILLVTGEAHHRVNLPYFLQVIQQIRSEFSTINMEVQPLETEEYHSLHQAGVHGIYVYQETYHPTQYKIYHPKGRKSNFGYRISAPDRIGQAGIHKMGLGVLLGLEDWRTDSFFTALHTDYLQNKYWKTSYSISFPRLRPAEGFAPDKNYMSDRELAQLIFAYRIWNPELELSLSTRERPAFRDGILPLGISHLSAASRTEPGGYAQPNEALEQFEIDDDRSHKEIEQLIHSKGLFPLLKDWHPAYD